MHNATCVLDDDHHCDRPLHDEYYNAVIGREVKPGSFYYIWSNINYDVYDEKDVHAMTMMNIMCGNIRMDCAYAANYYWTYQMNEDECLEHCLDQHWDVASDDWRSPCEGRPNLESGIWDDDNWVTENLFSDEVR